MAAKSPNTRLAAALTALRGIILVVGGLFALFYPELALRFLIFIGGGLLLVDGVLNLATLRLDGERDTDFWVTATRCGLAIVAGLAVVFSPWLIPMVGLAFLIWFVGLQALAIGLIEIFDLLVLKKKDRAAVWPSLITAGAYALFGLMLIIIPLSAAAVLVQIVAVLALVFAVSLFLQLWRQRSKGLVA